jgi:dihydropteroate synthase
LPRHELLTCARTQGVINATPDSFSDGGDFFDIETAVRHAKELVRKPWPPRPSDALWRLMLHFSSFLFFSLLVKQVEGGAHILDIGGQSTNPRSTLLSAEEEVKRVVPLVQALRSEANCAWMKVLPPSPRHSPQPKER